jgi:hypothetical protein
VSPHPPFAWPCPQWLFPIPPRWNYSWKDIVLTWLRRSMPNRKRLSTHIWELPGMHEIMGNMLGSLYTCPRGLLRRREWKLGVTIRNHSLWSNSPKFCVAPRISHLSHPPQLHYPITCAEECISWYSVLHIFQLPVNSTLLLPSIYVLLHNKEVRITDTNNLKYISNTRINVNPTWKQCLVHNKVYF